VSRGVFMRVVTVLVMLSIVMSEIPASAQRRVDARDLYERLVCVVPMTGRGTYEDPRRPLFTPATQASESQREGAGIISFSYQLSDDGNFAVVELVARDRKAFAAILGDRRPDIKVFERGKANAAVVEAEIRKYVKNFDVNKFGARAH
jgi:hypothetical protein